VHCFIFNKRNRKLFLGCQAQSGESLPPRWNNFEHSTLGPTSTPLDTSSVERTKRRGEHIAWIDTQMISSTRTKSESVVRTAMQTFLTMSSESQATISTFCQRNSISGWSVLCLFDESIFRLTRDLTIDGMHLLVKGILGKLLSLTFAEQFEDREFSLRHVAGNREASAHSDFNDFYLTHECVIVSDI
jgi:hypothetical protein